MGIADKIENLIEVGWKADSKYAKEWKLRVTAFLRSAGLAGYAEEFKELANASIYWEENQATSIGFLEGLLEAQSNPNAISGNGALLQASQGVYQQLHSKRVFIVHGHDTEVKETVARFLDRLGLEPIILHEQPSSGLTVIEKFEAFANVGFAVVLLTPDDVGAMAADQTSLKKRARQNVILELGYFLGKLSRKRVCALYKKDIEIPSDYQGVLYVEFDPAGAWRTKVAQELVEAGFSINLDALLKS